MTVKVKEEILCKEGEREKETEGDKFRGRWGGRRKKGVEGNNETVKERDDGEEDGE